MKSLPSATEMRKKTVETRARIFSVFTDLVNEKMYKAAEEGRFDIFLDVPENIDYFSLKNFKEFLKEKGYKIDNYASGIDQELVRISWEDPQEINIP